MNYIYLFFAIVLNIVGQFSLKYGVNIFDKQYNGLKFPQILFSKFVIIGFLLYGISALFWIKAISKINLNIAYPTLAFGYVIVYFASSYFLKEPIYLKGIIGVGFIIIGIILVNLK